MGGPRPYRNPSSADVAAVTRTKTGSGASRRAARGQEASAAKSPPSTSSSRSARSNPAWEITPSEKAKTAAARTASSRSCLRRTARTFLGKVPARRSRGVAPGEDSCPPMGGHGSSSPGALWAHVPRPYRGCMNTFQNLATLSAHSRWHHDGGWWLPFGLLWLVLFAAAIWFVVRNVNSRQSSATDILAERYARGELSSEEYRDRLEELRRHR